MHPYMPLSSIVTLDMINALLIMTVSPALTLFFLISWVWLIWKHRQEVQRMSGWVLHNASSNQVADLNGTALI